MIRFVKNILASIHWAQSQDRYYKESYQGALDAYNKFAGLKEPQSVHLAYYATLQIALGNSHLAKKEFGKVMKRLEQLPKSKCNDNSRYVSNYTRMYLSLIRKSDDHRTYWNAAKALAPDDAIIRWLPLPDKFDFEKN